MKSLLLIAALMALAGCTGTQDYACESGCKYDSTITLPAPAHGYNARCSTDTECEEMYGTEE